jgi:hypothetical protein
MSVRNRLVLPVILSSFAVLVGCGGSSNPTVTPPPSGSFSNSNLSGTYVFSVTGSDLNGNFVTMMGTFTADGKGNISGGVIDKNGTAGSPLLGAGITSGSYIVGKDGRPAGSSSVPTGLLTLQSGTSAVFTFDFVLTSSQHGLITEFDNLGSASGTLDLQSTVTQANINGQSYAFNLTGTDGVGTTLCGVATGGPLTPIPFSTVGAFTLDANGNISTGVADFNNNCVSNGSTNVSVTQGSVTLGSGANFGKAALTTTTGSAVTYSFDVLAIDSTHLKFIETDTQPTLVGDAFTQAPSIASGNNVFTVAGFDSSSAVSGPFTAAGLIVTDGSGNITSGSAEDINDGGAAAVIPSFTGSYTKLAGGRSEFTLSGFVNGNDLVACSSCLFAVYPSSGGLQMLEIDDGGMTNGIAYPQSATTFAAGEGYGMNLSGATPNSSEDDIAEFTNNNGSFSGIIDINDQGMALSFKNSYAGNYTADTSVPGRGTVTNTKNGPLLTTYVVDSSTSVAVSTDPNMVGLGALVTQNASAKSNVVANHLAVLRTAPSPRIKSAKKKSAATR